jgi:ADP-ribosyl-[dinitrogen reductase] hydrolase
MFCTYTEGVIIDTKNTPISIIQNRAVGCLVAQAIGDALGVAHELKHWSEIPIELELTGGGPFSYPPASFSDDTEMTIPIARIAARGDDLIEHIPEIIKSWRDWLAQGPRDVGSQTRAVLSSLQSNDEAEAWKVSKNYFEKSGQAAGNGALMRTASVALAYLDDPVRMAEAARRIAQLTHFEDDAWQACVLWCASIRHAVLTGELDLRAGLELLPGDSRELWENRITLSTQKELQYWSHNGWVVHAFQAAACAASGSQTATEAVQRAVRVGGDTDTVAAIAGALAGALYGVSSLPQKWKSEVHGWPGIRYRDLLEMAVLAVNKGQPDPITGWPLCDRMPTPLEPLAYPHPEDMSLWLGNIRAVDDINVFENMELVALCRVGRNQVPAGVPVHEVWLVDRPGENLNLEFILEDTALFIRERRAAGKMIFLFCYAAENRTPMIAEAYGNLVNSSK